MRLARRMGLIMSAYPTKKRLDVTGAHDLWRRADATRLARGTGPNVFNEAEPPNPVRDGTVGAPKALQALDQLFDSHGGY